MDLNQLLGFLTQYKPQLLTMGALVIADLALGVLAAFKNNEFDFQRVGDFYRQKVVPGLGGWVVFSAVSHLISPDLVGSDLLGVVGANSAFGVAVVSLTASIIKSARDLGLPLPALKQRNA